MVDSGLQSVFCTAISASVDLEKVIRTSQWSDSIKACTSLMLSTDSRTINHPLGLNRRSISAMTTLTLHLQKDRLSILSFSTRSVYLFYIKCKSTSFTSSSPCWIDGLHEEGRKYEDMSWKIHTNHDRFQRAPDQISQAMSSVHRTVLHSSPRLVGTQEQLQICISIEKQIVSFGKAHQTMHFIVQDSIQINVFTLHKLPSYPSHS